MHPRWCFQDNFLIGWGFRETVNYCKTRVWSDHIAESSRVVSMHTAVTEWISTTGPSKYLFFWRLKYTKKTCKRKYVDWVWYLEGVLLYNRKCMIPEFMIFHSSGYSYQTEKVIQSLRSRHVSWRLVFVNLYLYYLVVSRDQISIKIELIQLKVG